MTQRRLLHSLKLFLLRRFGICVSSWRTINMVTAQLLHWYTTVYVACVVAAEVFACFPRLHAGVHNGFSRSAGLQKKDSSCTSWSPSPSAETWDKTEHVADNLSDFLFPSRKCTTQLCLPADYRKTSSAITSKHNLQRTTSKIELLKEEFDILKNLVQV